MDSKYRFKLNLRSICYFEEMADKSFLDTAEADIPMLIYSIFISSNPDEKITYEAFLNVLKNKKFLSSFMADLERQMENFKLDLEKQVSKNEDKGDDEGNERMWFSDIAAMLIIECGIDAHYVYEEMPIYEIFYYIKAMEKKVHADIEMSRLWTFLQMLPHIGSNKIKEPSDILPLPWEETRQQRKQKELEAMKSSLKNIFKKKTDNGTTESDTKA